MKFEIHLIGPHSDGKTRLLNWLSAGSRGSNSDIPLVTSHFTVSNSSQWTSDYHEANLMSFVSCYVNSLIDNAVSILTNGTVNKVITDNISRLSEHTIFTAFIWNTIGYSEFVSFPLAKPVTIVTFDVPQQQDKLPLTTSELCRVMENIESYSNGEYGSSLLVILLGIHNSINSTILDQCRNNILDCINGKSYRSLIAANPKHAVMFFDCQCEGSCEVKQLIVDKVEECRQCISTQLLSTDHCTMLQYVIDNAVVMMSKKQFTSSVTLSNRSIEQLSADGVICHFDQCPSLQEIVFTSPHWLNDIITLLTSPVGCTAVRAVYDGNGVISEQLLDQMLQSLHNTTAVKLTQVMMSLLVHLNLAVPLSSDMIGEAILVSGNKATALLVPSLVNNDCSAVTSPATLTDTIILFTTSNGGLYYTTQLLVKLLSWGLSKGHHLIRLVCVCVRACLCIRMSVSLPVCLCKCVYIHTYICTVSHSYKLITVY